MSDIFRERQDAELVRAVAPPVDPLTKVRKLSAKDILTLVGLAAIITVFFLVLGSDSLNAIIIFGAFMLFFSLAVGKIIYSYVRTRKIAFMLIPYWRESMDIWKRLYYCESEQIVFDPKTGAQARPEDTFGALLHYPPQIPGVTAPKEKKNRK
ncbi:MAG: hypothetical protein JW750_06580 [Anaerolineaceae bacterium]|nr:hypothetical protein [Anaerolineaceae bacterium]